jgi:hypothetical protein
MTIIFNLPRDVNVLNIIPQDLVIQNPLEVINLIERTNQAMQTALNLNRRTQITCFNRPNR